MMYRLIFLTGSLKGQRVTVTDEPMTIGRDPACSICLPDSEVASKHAVLEHKSLTGLHISDLGSMNKMLINNREAKESKLKHGDIVEIGRNRFLVQATVETDLTKKAAGIRMKRISLTPLVIIIPLLVVIYTVISFCHRIMNESSAIPPVRVAAGASVRTNLTPTQAVAVIVKPAERVVTNTPLPVASTNMISDEIRQMREDLVGIKQTVKELSSKPALPALPIPPEGKQQPRTPLFVAATNQPPRIPAVAAPTNQPPPETPDPHITIASLEEQRFLENEDVDEMRVLTIGLQRDPAVKIMKENAVRIEVSFFDQTSDGKSIVPTSAVVPTKPLTPPQWHQDTQAVARASYVVPKGTRKTNTQSAPAEQFYGYVIRVFYRDKLQDEDARPKALLNYSAGTLRKQKKTGGTVEPH